MRSARYYSANWPEDETKIGASVIEPYREQVHPTADEEAQAMSMFRVLCDHVRDDYYTAHGAHLSQSEVLARVPSITALILQYREITEWLAREMGKTEAGGEYQL